MIDRYIQTHIKDPCMQIYMNDEYIHTNERSVHTGIHERSVHTYTQWTIHTYTQMNDPYIHTNERSLHTHKGTILTYRHT